ncbi:uncharacterized protein LOC112880107 [Panicum hallii]|jgi:hypothetical protein|uniref:uncharacterized protein LOC112880107 n=1 Tax=Panicum hallii TaxID=206008 RepID=UPI000DF4EEDC|nr:uncharacterized protein LOC112880107 [Panicum hallii]
MGSNKPLGEPQEQEAIDLDADAPKSTLPSPLADNECKSNAQLSSGCKRKRGLNKEEGSLFEGLIKSVDGFANAMREETFRIYRVVMDYPNFNKEDLMRCLSYLMKNKGIAEGFMEMDEVDKDFWLRDHLSNTNFYA